MIDFNESDDSAAESIPRQKKNIREDSLVSFELQKIRE